ncbi:MAG TPA: hypothetical protein VGH81_12280 [Rudaea sp.]|jgi:hypothetical protein
MYRTDRGIRQGKQAGTTLVVALVLILLATLLGLFALSVGLSGQRASANDVKARLVQQTAEAALAQGIEYISQNNSTFLDTTVLTNWELCDATDAYPCGAVPLCASAVSYSDSGGVTRSSDGSTTCYTALARRANMYRFIGGGTTLHDVNGDGHLDDIMDQRSLPLAGQLNSVGNGYTVNYGVGAVMCKIKTPSSSTEPTQCTTDSSQISGTYAITLVATANIGGEGAKTTLTTTIGRSSSIYSPVNKPPVVASGTITTNGNFQVVTNPNAGGNGVPVSMWTRLAVDKTGTPNTCYLDGMIHGGSPQYEGTTKVITCDGCNCSSTESLSFPSSGNKAQQGIDIVDVDPTTPQCTTSVSTDCKPNLDIQPGEFPCDLFQYVFGDQAWLDVDGDKFCESRLTAYSTGSPSGTKYTIGEDENYLLARANYILPNTSAPYYADLASMTSATILSSCNDLLDSAGKIAGGIVWDQQGCGFKDQIGNPDVPVVLVEDGKISINAGGRLFGLLFVRPALYGATHGPDDPTQPYDANILSPTTGATASSGANLSNNGHANIYGSVVIQGTADKINGTGAIIYSATVLTNLGNEANLNKISPVPGSWTDRYAY